MIDNFVVSGEAKWGLQSSLVLNLPHGMDGQGPEHSSARLERFLQLSNDSADVEVTKQSAGDRVRDTNIQVAYCSTSANYFHVLRRQLKRDYRKPLILMVSKKLLKLKSVTDSLLRQHPRCQTSSKAQTSSQLSKNPSADLPPTSRSSFSVLASSTTSSKTLNSRRN